MPQIPPFNPQTPWLAQAGPDDKQPPWTVNYPHAQLLIALQRAASAAPQVASTVPANSSAPGTTGQIVFSPSFAYLCIATNVWRRFALSAF